MVQQKNDIISALKSANRAQFAAIAGEFWHSTLEEYSSTLYTNLPQPAIEPELISALEQECQRLGYTGETLKNISGSLERLGVLQTTTHLCISEGPTFFAAHQMATRAFPTNEYYIVGAFSNVPFSNSAWPGCFNYSSQYSVQHILDENCPGFNDFLRAEKNRRKDTDEMRLSVTTGTFRDARVYRAELPNKLLQIQPFFTPSIEHITPALNNEKSFSRWALGCAEKQMRQILGHNKIVYIDLNEVLVNYLQQVLLNTRHPLYRLFFDASTQHEVLSVFGKQLAIFTIPVERRSKWKQENLYLHGTTLSGHSHSLEFDQESLIAGLQSGYFCPTVFLCFMILSFINGIKCLGGFNQIEYLQLYQQKLKDIHWLDQDLVQSAMLTGLTSGRTVDAQGQAVFPLDIFLGSPWEAQESQLIGDWFHPLIAKLIN